MKIGIIFSYLVFGCVGPQTLLIFIYVQRKRLERKKPKHKQWLTVLVG